MQYFMNEHIDIFQYNLEAFGYNMNSRTIERKILFQNEKNLFLYTSMFLKIKIEQNPNKIYS